MQSDSMFVNSTTRKSRAKPAQKRFCQQNPRLNILLSRMPAWLAADEKHLCGDAAMIVSIGFFRAGCSKKAVGHVITARFMSGFGVSGMTVAGSLPSVRDVRSDSKERGAEAWHRIAIGKA